MKYLVLLTALISQSVLAGDIYKWTDNKGVVHFGGRPPAEKNVQNLQKMNDKQSRKAQLQEQEAAEREYAMIMQCQATATRMMTLARNELANPHANTQSFAQRIMNDGYDKAYKRWVADWSYDKDRRASICASTASSFLQMMKECQ